MAGELDFRVLFPLYVTHESLPLDPKTDNLPSPFLQVSQTQIIKFYIFASPQIENEASMENLDWKHLFEFSLSMRKPRKLTKVFVFTIVLKYACEWNCCIRLLFTCRKSFTRGSLNRAEYNMRKIPVLKLISLRNHLEFRNEKGHIFTLQTQKNLQNSLAEARRVRHFFMTALPPFIFHVYGTQWKLFIFTIIFNTNSSYGNIQYIFEKKSMGKFKVIRKLKNRTFLIKLLYLCNIFWFTLIILYCTYLYGQKNGNCVHLIYPA